MKTTIAGLVLVLLSAIVAFAADVDTIRVPKDRPTEILASMSDEVYSKAVVVHVIDEYGKDTTIIANNLSARFDTVEWVADGNIVRVPTKRLVSVLSPPIEHMGVGTFVAYGALAGVIAGVLVGGAVATNPSQTTGAPSHGAQIGIMVGLGALTGGIIGGVVGGIVGGTGDGTIWIFEH